MHIIIRTYSIHGDAFKKCNSSQSTPNVMIKALGVSNIPIFIGFLEENVFFSFFFYKWHNKAMWLCNSRHSECSCKTIRCQPEEYDSRQKEIIIARILHKLLPSAPILHPAHPHPLITQPALPLSLMGLRARSCDCCISAWWIGLSESAWPSQSS